MRTKIILLAGLFALFSVSTAHAQCAGTAFTKSSLAAQVTTDFPTQTSFAITPSILSTFQNNLIGSYAQQATINAQVGTSYGLVADTSTTSDNGKLVTFNNAAPVAVTIGNASTAGWCPYNVYLRNLGAGAVTITPAAGTINGTATLVLAQLQGSFLVSDGTNWQVYGSGVLATPASASVFTASPTGLTPNTSTAQMDGLSSGTTTITPTATGRIRIDIDGSILVGSVTNGAILQCRFGTGNGPANAAAVTGNACGAANSGQITYLAGATTAKTPFHTGGVVTGLALNTAIWIDISAINTTGSQAISFANVTVSAHEF
jgi:hypothetical protein